MNKRFCDTFDLRYIHISTYYVYLCIISNRDITILLYNISIYKPDKPRAKLYTYYSSVFINDNCNALRFTQHKKQNGTWLTWDITYTNGQTRTVDNIRLIHDERIDYLL